MGKTQSSFYTLATININTISIGADFSVPAACKRIDVRIDFAQYSVTAPASGTDLIIQGSQLSSGNNNWIELQRITTGITAAATATTSGATAGVGSTTFATSGFAATFGARAKWIFVADGTLANSEWLYMKNHASSVVNLIDATTVSHASGTTLYDQAIRKVLQFDTSGLSRLRLIIDNNVQATGPTIAVQASAMMYTT